MPQSLRACQMEGQLLAAHRRVDEQQTKLQRLIVGGAPTQAAEDQLRRLKEALAELKQLAASRGPLAACPVEGGSTR
jgi:hypothetical protein